MSVKTSEFERTVYSVLDFLGDVGGLYDAFYYIAYFLFLSTRITVFEVWLTGGIQRIRKYQKSFSHVDEEGDPVLF